MSNLWGMNLKSTIIDYLPLNIEQFTSLTGYTTIRPEMYISPIQMYHVYFDEEIIDEPIYLLCWNNMTQDSMFTDRLNSMNTLNYDAVWYVSKGSVNELKLARDEGYEIVNEMLRVYPDEAYIRKVRGC
ncbi:unnamed protein product [Trichobilharzia regenti]|nr:unnamed protein product [Trichobilharzia regenti]